MYMYAHMYMYMYMYIQYLVISVKESIFEDDVIGIVHTRFLAHIQTLVHQVVGGAAVRGLGL